MKIKTTYEGCPYITAGKVYEAMMIDSDYVELVDDEGCFIDVWLDSCGHLNHIGTWEVVEE